MKTLLSVLLLLAFVTPALAEHNPLNLEQRVRVLERQMTRLNQRVVELEYANGGGPSLPMPAYEANCSVVDSYYGKTHLGTGTTKIDAEYNARKACSNVTSGSNCTGASAILKCDDVASSRPSVCIVTDSYYGKVHRGEGSTRVAAEAKARKACEQTTSGSNCSGASAKVQCDARY
jgi:hypothetical protein